MDKEQEALGMLREKRKRDLTNKELAEEYDVSQSTVSRRLKLARKEEKEMLKKMDEKIEEKNAIRVDQGDGGNELALQDVVSVLDKIEKDEKTAESVGQLSGVNMNSIFYGINKAAAGEADRRELGSLAKNIAGVIYGFHTADEARKEEQAVQDDNGGQEKRYSERDLQKAVETALKHYDSKDDKDDGGE